MADINSESPLSTQDDIINLLSEGDTEDETETNEESSEESTDETGDEEEEAGSEDTEEEKLELKEDEEEKTEESEEDDLADSFQPFNKKKFLTKYPNAFKEFPALEKGYYANKAYREVFPTLADAKEASEKLETLDKHVKSLEEGKSSLLFKELKEKNPENFGKVVDNYLSELLEVDSKAYYHVIGNVLEDALLMFYDAAEKNESEDGKNAAKMFKQFFFQNKEVKGSKPFEQKSPEKSKVDEERQKWNQEKLTSAQSEINSRVDSILSSTIRAAFAKEERMTPFVRKQAVELALKMTKKSISSDTQFQTVLKKMWDKSQELGLSQDSQNRIKAAYDSKAKAILPTILRKVRTEALSGTSGKSSETLRTRTLPPGGGSSSSTGKSKSGDPKQFKSTFDFLNSD